MAVELVDLPYSAADRDQVLCLYQDMHRQSWYRDMDLSLEKIGWMLDLVERKDRNWFGQVLINPFGLVAGFMFAGVQEHFFGRDRFAADCGLYVDPDYRGGTHFLRLVRAYEAWAREQPQVTEILVGVSSGIADARVVALYEKLGYTKGSFMLHKKCID